MDVLLRGGGSAMGLPCEAEAGAEAGAGTGAGAAATVDVAFHMPILQMLLSIRDILSIRMLSIRGRARFAWLGLSS